VRRLLLFRHAQPDDVFTLMEVADTSLGYDRGRKLKAYARSGILEYWIVNLNADFVEAFHQPSHTGYGVHVVASHGETLGFEAFPDEPLPLDDVPG
jgi:Uma2 family endonuclease